MAFLSSLQQRVLKTSLIPALIIWALTEFGSLPAFFNTAIVLTLFFAWEFIIEGKLVNIFVILAVILVFWGVQYSLEVNFITNFFRLPYPGNVRNMNLSSFLLLSHLYAFIPNLMVIIIRFHLKGTERKYTAGILAALIFYLLPKTANPFSSGPLHFIMQPWLVIIINLLIGYCKIIFYYVLVSLIENSFAEKNIVGKLYSKIQLLNKWEYLFIWIATFFIFVGCVGDLNTRIEVMFAKDLMNGEPQWLSIIYIFADVLFLYAGALLLRNIISSRALTTHTYNPWLLLLHLIPGLNIIAVFICFFAKEREGTVVDNGLDYTNTNRGLAKKVMIAIGILITLYNIYNMLVVPTGLRLVGIGVLSIIYLLKIGAYIRLPNNKLFVYAVVGLNILAIAYSIDDRFIIYLSLIYLYYYFLVELFYPELEPEDITEVKNVQGL
jgi:hypothetical protein